MIGHSTKMPSLPVPEKGDVYPPEELYFSRPEAS